MPNYNYIMMTSVQKYHDVWRNKVIAYIDVDSVSQDQKSQEVGEQLVVTSSSSIEVLTKMIVEQVLNCWLIVALSVH